MAQRAAFTHDDSTCFLICPIGESGNEIRLRADLLLKHVVAPAAARHGLQAVRSDTISTPGIISSQIIRQIINARIVVADLTGRNPNVFYELALRHAFAKPVVQLMAVGEAIPFDVAPTRTIRYELDLDAAAEARDELTRQIGSALDKNFHVESPVSVAASLQDLYRHAHPETQVLESILEQLVSTKEAISELSRLYRPAASANEIPQYVQDRVESVMGRYEREITLIESARFAGITGIHKRRQMAVHDFAGAIDEELREIVIIGSSLKGLLQLSEYRAIADKIKFKVSAGVSVKFLLTHPIVADFRANQENRRPTEIGREIIASLETLRGWGVPCEQVRLYLGTPTCFAIKTSREMIVNPYPYISVSYDSPCLSLQSSAESGLGRPGYFFDEFNSRHFGAWDTDLAVEIRDYSETIDNCRAHLGAYAESVEALISRGKTSVNR